MSKAVIAFLVAFVVAGIAAQNSKPQPEDGAALLKRMREKLSTVKTVTGTLEIKDSELHAVAFKAMRPGFVSAVNPEFELHATGGAAYMYMPEGKMYIKLPDTQLSSMSMILLGYESLFSTQDPPYAAVGMAKPAFFKGQKALAVALSQAGGPGQITLYVEPDSLQPMAAATPDGQYTLTYKDVKLGEPLKPEDFAWTPPADAKDMTSATSVTQGQSLDANLLKKGTQAPDFTLKTPSGAAMKLSASLGKRATIVNFWSYG